MLPMESTPLWLLIKTCNMNKIKAQTNPALNPFRDLEYILYDLFVLHWSTANQFKLIV